MIAILNGLRQSYSKMHGGGKWVVPPGFVKYIIVISVGISGQLVGVTSDSKGVRETSSDTGRMIKNAAG